MQWNGDGCGDVWAYCGGMFDFKQLDIWHRSIALSVEVREASDEKRTDGLTGLRAQLTRACRAVPANIAEGAGQATAQQTARFLDIAIGSLSEAESHVEEARLGGLIDSAQCDKFSAEIREIRRMTHGFKRWVLRKKA